jgi:hypothetical protein
LPQPPFCCATVMTIAMRAVSMPVNASQFQVAAIRGQNKTG